VPSLQCAKCATKLPEGAQFCLKCGQAVGKPTPVAAAPVIDASLACSKCGAELPPEAQFCLQCGKPVSVSAKPAAPKSAAATPPAPPPAPPKRKRHIVLWTILAALLLAVVWAGTSESPMAQGIQDLVGWKHDQTILDKPFSVGPRTFRYYKFALPPGSLNVAMAGQFTASAESSRGTANNGDAGDNNIEVYVLSEPAFTVWQNGYATSSLYDSGQVSQGTVRGELPAGAGIYYLVFSNKFSPKTAKNVHATVFLRYKSWLPESLRRGLDRFWNWLGL
jgi:ribosomal protein L40E